MKFLHMYTLYSTSEEDKSERNR